LKETLESKWKNEKFFPVYFGINNFNVAKLVSVLLSVYFRFFST
jgi:hypothetical protein